MPTRTCRAINAQLRVRELMAYTSESSFTISADFSTTCVEPMLPDDCYTSCASRRSPGVGDHRSTSAEESTRRATPP